MLTPSFLNRLLNKAANIGGIIEWQNCVADNLTGLVAFTGDQYDVVGTGLGDSLRDGGTAIANVLRQRASRQNSGANTISVFVARIVISDDNMLGVLSRHTAH
jgi:hypothetical protein